MQTPVQTRLPRHLAGNIQRITSQQHLAARENPLSSVNYRYTPLCRRTLYRPLSAPEVFAYATLCGKPEKNAEKIAVLSVKILKKCLARCIVSDE